MSATLVLYWNVTTCLLNFYSTKLCFNNIIHMKVTTVLAAIYFVQDYVHIYYFFTQTK